MQSYKEFERQEMQQLMKKDLALVKLQGTPIYEEAPMCLEDFLIQDKPEPVIDKSYRLHQEQRKANKKVNLSFNKLAFSVKQQISLDKQGEKHGNVD